MVSSVSSSNNQALRSSSQQRSTAAAQNQAPVQTQLQQSARKQTDQRKQQVNPDAEASEEDPSSASDVKFQCPRPDGLFADPCKLEQ